jgi:hypothetical protein
VATRRVVVSVCDRCTTEVSTPLKNKRRRSELVLPHGWLHVAGNTATSLVFEMDLCPDCKKFVIEAAGKARQVHSTTSKPKPQPEVIVSKETPKQDDKDLVDIS